MLLGGVVDQDVELAELLDRPLDHFLAERLFADVPGHRQTATTFGLHQADGLSRVDLLGGKMHDHDISAFLGIRHGDRAADTAVAPGDDRDLSVKLSRSPVVTPGRLRRGVISASIPGCWSCVCGG